MAGVQSVASTKETTNYARLCRLLVDTGSQALRDTFDGIHAPVTLHTVLVSHPVCTTLQDLRRKKILNPAQWGKLYPAIASSVSSSTFDITLLMVLLRNICGLTPPATGWDALPPDTDKSREADIARLKYFRNAVIAHAEQARVDDVTFNTHWQNIQDVLVRLGRAKYGDAVDKLKTECMDPAVEEYYKELLEQLKQDEYFINDQLQEMGNDIKSIKEMGNDIKYIKEVLRKAVDKPMIKEIKSGIASLEVMRNHQLEYLQKTFKHTYDAVIWLRKNRHIFKGAVHEPVLLQSTPIESLISQNDLRAFVCNNREDFKLFLDEVLEKQGLKVNVVTPPDKPLESFKPSRSLKELGQWGFYCYLKDLVTVHDDVMRYLCQSYHIHDIPVGNDWTTRHEAKVFKESGIKMFYTSTLRRCQVVQRKKNILNQGNRSTALFSCPISVKRC